MSLQLLNTRIVCVALLQTAIIAGVIGAEAQIPTSTSPIQLVPRTKAQREQRYEASHRITLMVQVTDSSGKPATGLKPEDFGLLDGQKPQKIATFSEVDGEKSAAAVRVLVVLDAINDGGTSITRLKKDLGKLFSGGNGPLQFPLSLVFVSASGVTESQPSTDRGALAAELAELARRPHDQDCEQGGNTIEGSRMGGGRSGLRGKGSQPRIGRIA